MKIHDENNIPQLLEVLGELGELEIEIGVLGEGKGGKKHDDAAATVVEIANYHEFGTRHIPERSFIRASFDENLDDYHKKTGKLIREAMEFETDVSGIAEGLGMYIVGQTQEYLTELSDPPLKQATIAKKKSSQPLIDTGQLRSSIEWKKV